MQLLALLLVVAQISSGDTVAVACEANQNDSVVSTSQGEVQMLQMTRRVHPDRVVMSQSNDTIVATSEQRTRPESQSNDNIGSVGGPEVSWDQRKKTFIDVVKAFQAAGVEFVLGYGTALGVYREGSLLDKDDDVDFMVSDDTFPLVYDALEQLDAPLSDFMQTAKKKQGVYRCLNGSFCRIRASEWGPTKLTWGPVDIYRVSHVNASQVQDDEESNLLCEPHLKVLIPEQQLFPAQLMNVSGFPELESVPMPNMPDAHLVQIYGSNWSIPASGKGPWMKSKPGSGEWPRTEEFETQYARLCSGALGDFNMIDEEIIAIMEEEDEGASLFQQPNPLSRTQTEAALEPQMLVEEWEADRLEEATRGKGIGESYNETQFLSPEDALARYQLLHSIRMLFQRHKIWHAACCGTLLGAVRNKGIIPHDDDLDLHIMRDDFNLTIALRADLKRNGLNIKEINVVRKPWNVLMKMIKVGMIEHPHVEVDLFELVKKGDKLSYPEEWQCNGTCLQTEWPASIAEEGGLIQWPFGSTTVPAPPREISETFLTSKYGHTWRDKSPCTGFHPCGTVEDLEYDVTGRALPDSPLEDPI